MWHMAHLQAWFPGVQIKKASLEQKVVDIHIDRWVDWLPWGSKAKGLGKISSLHPIPSCAFTVLNIELHHTRVFVGITMCQFEYKGAHQGYLRWLAAAEKWRAVIPAAMKGCQYLKTMTRYALTLQCLHHGVQYATRNANKWMQPPDKQKQPRYQVPNWR